MATTPHMGVTLIEQSQSQKEVTANAAFQKYDSILNTAVVDRDLDTPPVSPTDGDVYIPAATATGDWTGHEGKIAYYSDSAWNILTPNEGLVVWVADEDALIVYDGSAWVTAISNVANATKIGINTTADATNRLSVNTPAVLFNRETDDIQVKLNKEAAGDNASLIYQTNFSGRAEIGLTGDDDFHFKVSPDGSTFYESLILDKDSGRVTVNDSFLSFGTPESVTIASGAITVTKSFVLVDTEGGASTDDLTTINGGNQGDILILMAADTSHDVVLKDGSGTAGAINLSGDFTMDSDRDVVILIKAVDDEWYLISESSN